MIYEKIKEFLEENKIDNVKRDSYFDNMYIVNDCECIFEMCETDESYTLDNNYYLLIEEERDREDYFFIILGDEDMIHINEYYINGRTYDKLVRLTRKLLDENNMGYWL